MLRTLLHILLLLVPLFVHGQNLHINEQVQNIPIQKIVKSYRDESNLLTIQQIVALDSSNFKPIKHLNLGITYTNYWFRFSLKNESKTEMRMLLAFESITADSLFLYKTVNNKLVETLLLGEFLPFPAQKIKHRTPVFNIKLLPNEKANYFIFTRGNGQPLNLTSSLFSAEGFYAWGMDNRFFLGLLYGIMLLILIFNFSFFFITKEKIYLIFSIQVVFSTVSMLYFDGFIHQFLFPNNGYWSNEMIAVGMCGTFICNNFFIKDFFNLRERLPLAARTFRYLSYIVLGIWVVSFLHPLGFNIFIVSMTAITSLIAVLLFLSILILKKQHFLSYIFVLLATIFLIIFGSIFQAFIIGLVPDVFLSHNAIHIAVVTQSVFLALAVNDKFRVIREENAYFQQKLVENLNQYSQNLIENIEAERQRLAIDIHDGFGQNLLAMRNIILKSLKQKRLSETTELTLQTLLETTTETLEDARTMAYNLRPPILNTMGLTVAVETLVQKVKKSSNLKIEYNCDISLDGLIAKEHEINLYRILQESFTNTIKHANASNITINMELKDTFIEIQFRDNGIGFEQGMNTSGQGILGIKERVALLKGNIHFDSIPMTGTLISIKIPTN